MWRRALQRSVVGAALLVLLVLVIAGGCAGSDQLSTGPEVTSAEARVTPVSTTAPATLPVPTPTPLIVGVPTLEPSAEPSPVATVQATTEPTTGASPQPAATAPVSPSPASPTPLSPTVVPVAGSQQVLAANGAEVFTLNCARCHGENGMGSQQYSAGLIGVGSKYSTPGMIAELTNGHPITFGFADRLSVEEIASVVAYVKSVFP